MTHHDADVGARGTAGGVRRASEVPRHPPTLGRPLAASCACSPPQ